MSAFDFATESGLWSNEMVPGAGHYWRWDVTQSKLVNGDDGGIYNPTSPIGFGGAGLWLTSGASYIFGGVRTQTGGRIVLGTHDIPSLSNRSITRVMSLVGLPPENLQVNRGTLTSPGGTAFQFPVDAYLRVVPPGPNPCGISPADASIARIPIPSEYLVNGKSGGMNAQLASVTLNFTVLAKPAAVPTTFLMRPRVNFRDPTFAMAPHEYFGIASVQGGPANTVWKANHAFAKGWYVVPQTKPTTPSSYFKCVTAGTSGSTEPNWDPTPGAFINDGGVLWRCIGGTGQAYAPSVDAWYNHGQPQKLTAALDTDLSEATDLEAFGFLIEFLAMPTDGSILYHTLVFEYVNITKWTWL